LKALLSRIVASNPIPLSTIQPRVPSIFFSRGGQAVLEQFVVQNPAIQALQPGFCSTVLSLACVSLSCVWGSPLVEAHNACCVVLCLQSDAFPRPIYNASTPPHPRNGLGIAPNAIFTLVSLSEFLYSTRLGEQVFTSPPRKPPYISWSLIFSCAICQLRPLSREIFNPLGSSCSRQKPASASGWLAWTLRAQLPSQTLTGRADPSSVGQR